MTAIEAFVYIKNCDIIG